MGVSVRKIHIGRNVQRIREMKGLKQDALAQRLGITQQAVSNMEQSESIDDERLDLIAEILEVTREYIKSFREEAVFNNNAYDHSTIFNYVEQYLNPVEKIVELYERLLSEKDATIEMLKKNQKSS